MPNSIDERVVKMSFDNKQFESNVKTTMSSIDKLKASLNFKDSAKSFDNLSKSANNVNMKGLSSAVETVSVKFSALERIATGALMRIGARAADAGEKLLRALTIDNISAGWEKFGEKTTSVATLVGQGYEESVVNEQFERLNWFTDETSYNLTDMISNIAKFTATGQDLEKSVTAMEGIALWAAASGQNAAKASQAMYQLSQAMGKGALKYDDWKSIQNASMDTIEFRQQAVEAAIALGQMTKAGDDLYKVGKKTFTLSELFSSDALSREAWFTSDVMMKTFERYTTMVDTIYSMTEAGGGAYDTASAAIKALKEAGGEIDTFGLKVFEAGQQARTWKDVVDSVKDAVSTGWMNTFEILIGTSSEATKVWTDLANELWEIFAAGAGKRNDFLKEVFGSKESVVTADMWKDAFLGNASAAETFKMALSDVAKSAGIDLDSLIEKTGSFENSLSEGWLTTSIFNKALDQTESVAESTGKTLEDYMALRDEILRGDWGSGHERRERLAAAGFDPAAAQAVADDNTITKWYSIAKVQEVLGENTQETTKYTEEQLEQLKELKAQLDDTQTGIGAFYEALQGGDISGRTLLLESLANIYWSIKDAVTAVTDSFHELFTGPTASEVYDFLVRFNEWTQKLREGEGATKRLQAVRAIFTTIFSVVKIISNTLSAIGKGVIGVIRDVFSGLNINTDFLDRFTTFSERLKEFAKSSTIADTIGKAFEKLREAIKKVDFSKFTKNAGKLKKALKGLGKIVISLGKSFWDKLVPYISVVRDLFLRFVETIKNTGSRWLEFLGDVGGSLDPLETASSLFEKLHEKVIGIKDAVVEFFKTGGFKNFFSGLSGSADEGRKTIKDFIADVGEWLSGIDWGKVMVFTLGIGIAATLVTISKALKDIGSAFVAAKTMFGTVTSWIKSLKSKVSRTIKDLTKLILAFAAAVLVLVYALKQLKTLSPEELKTYGLALGIIAGGLAVIVGVLGILSGKMKNLDKVSLAFLAVSGSILLIVFALKMMQGIDYTNIGAGLAAISLLLFEATAAAIALSGFGGTKGAALTILAIGVSILILAKALQKVAEIPVDKIEQATDSLAKILIALGAAAFASSLGKRGGLNMLAIALSVLVMIGVLKLLSDDKIVAMVQKAMENIKEIGFVFAALAALSLISRLGGGKGSFSTGMGILAMVASIYLIIDIIKKINEISDSDLTKGLTVIGIITLFFIGFGRAMQAATANEKGNPIKAAAGILICAVALLVVYEAIKWIGQLRPDVLAKGLMSVVLIMTMMSILAASTKNAKFGALAGIALVLAAVVGGLALLMLFDFNDLVKRANLLVIVMGMMTIMMGVIGSMDIPIQNALVFAGMLLVLDLALAGIAKMFKDYSSDQLLAVCATIATVVLSIVGTLWVMSKIGIFGALEGAVAFGGAIAVLALIFGLLGEIASLIPEGNKEAILSGIDFVTEIMNKIAFLIGSTIASIAEGILSRLPAMGQYLSDFTSAAQPFFDMLSGMNTSILTGVGILVQTIASLTGNDGLSSALGNLVLNAFDWDDKLAADNIEDIKTFLNELAPALKGFDEALGDNIDSKKIQSAVDALGTLAGLNDVLPKEGGIIQKIAGTTDLDGFAKNIVSLGGALASFQMSISVTKLNPVDFENAKTAAGYIVELGKTLDPTGGIVQKFLGETHLDTFGTQMVALVGCLTAVQMNLNTVKIDAAKFETAATAAGYMAELARKLDPTGGAIQKFFGEVDMGTFGANVLSLVLKMVSTQRTLNGIDIDPDKFSVAATAAGYMVSLAEQLDPTGGIWQKWRGEQDLSDFGSKLEALGVNLKNFQESTTGISKARFESLAASIQAMIDLANSMFANTGNNLKNFGDKLPDFGKKVAEFVTSLSGVSIESIYATIGVLRSSADLSNAAKEAGSSLGDTLTAAFSMQVSATSAADAVSTFIGTALDGIDGFMSEFSSKGDEAAESFKSGLESEGVLSSVKTAGARIGNYAKNGLESTIGGFTTVASNCVSGLYNGLLSPASMNKLYSAGVQMGRQILAGINSTGALDQNSPSKAMIRVGETANEGLLIGLYSMLGLVHEAGVTLGQEALFGSQSAMDLIGDMVGDDMVFSPTVRPVLDLTNIQNGSSQIAALFSRRQALIASAGFSRGSGGSTNGQDATTTNYNFTQNNYSPKALSRQEIYRQTRNQFSALERQLRYT